MGAAGRTTALLGAALLLAGCTGAGGGPRATGTTTQSATSSASRIGSAVLGTATLTCADDIDGGAPPDGYTVVEGAVALPTAPRSTALRTAPTRDVPKLFAKTGLIVRAGVASEIDVPNPVDAHVGIGWNNGPAAPGRHFVIPACPDAEGTGWLAYPGGLWADAPLCLPLVVRRGETVQQVEIGVGTACPGQAAPPTP